MDAMEAAVEEEAERQLAEMNAALFSKRKKSEGTAASSTSTKQSGTDESVRAAAAASLAALDAEMNMNSMSMPSRARLDEEDGTGTSTTVGGTSTSRSHPHSLASSSSEDFDSLDLTSDRSSYSQLLLDPLTALQDGMMGGPGALDMEGNVNATSTNNDDETSSDASGSVSLLARFHHDGRVKAAMEEGVDLRLYARQIETELEEYEEKCIQDYLHDGDNLAALHSSILRCDSILSSMEGMLQHFQSDLAAISSEIHSLQEKSTGMNVKLKNYKLAEDALHSFIESSYISEELAKPLLEGDVQSESWVESLKELDRKIAFLRSRKGSQAASVSREGMGGESQVTITTTSGGSGGSGGSHSIIPPSSTLAACDMLPLALKLSLRCLSRIRSFLFERFHSLKKPKTNIQIKQKVLMKYAPMYAFLLRHTPGHGEIAGLDMDVDIYEHHLRRDRGQHPISMLLHPPPHPPHPPRACPIWPRRSGVPITKPCPRSTFRNSRGTCRNSRRSSGKPP